MPSELRILLAGRIGLTNWPDSLSKDELIEAQIQALHTLIVVHLIPKYLLRWDVDSLPNKASEDLNSFVFELKNSISNESNELQEYFKNQQENNPSLLKIKASSAVIRLELQDFYKTLLKENQLLLKAEVKSAVITDFEPACEKLIHAVVRGSEVTLLEAAANLEKVANTLMHMSAAIKYVNSDMNYQSAFLLTLIDDKYNCISKKYLEQLSSEFKNIKGRESFIRETLNNQKNRGL